MKQFADPWTAYEDDEKYNWFQEDENDPKRRLCPPAVLLSTASDDDDGNANPFGAAEDMSRGAHTECGGCAMDRLPGVCPGAGMPSRVCPWEGAKVQVKLGKKVVDKVLVKADRDSFASVVFNNVPYEDGGGVYQYQVSAQGVYRRIPDLSRVHVGTRLIRMVPVPGSGMIEE